MKIATTKVGGKTVKVGDTVGFKSDVEQYGEIVGIQKGTFCVELVLEDKAGFVGDYIGGQTSVTIPASDAWLN